MDTQEIFENVHELAQQFARQRNERQRRRHLDPHDFDRLKEAGYLLLAVPAAQDGAWQDLQHSTRPICETLRVLARSDSSVALVSSMHPVVLGLWLANPTAPRPHQRAWRRQRERVFETARNGAWWGTITSESGSGGDIMNTTTVAVPAPGRRPDGRYCLSGCKHFGTGLGIVSYMITAAVPDGEDAPDWFFMNLQDVPWDGTAGVKLLGEWDGHGMIATHSHSMMFEDFAAERLAWPGHLLELAHGRDGFAACVFTAVIVGIVEAAVYTAREQLRPTRGSLDAYRQVEWSKAEMESWLVHQAYEGMLRAMEAPGSARPAAIMGKTAIAELAESVLQRIVRIMGGGTYARRSPFGFWHQDVRALGFLRPPWGLAFEELSSLVWELGT